MSGQDEAKGEGELVQIRLRPREEAALPADSDLPRRTFLQLLGTTAGLAGTGLLGAAMAGCERGVPQPILPSSTRPRGARPGVPREYATAMMLGGFATGLLVKSQDGRPIKVEGNPDHPASLGGCGLAEQASVLTVYDPDRAAQVRLRWRAASWRAVLDALRAPQAGHGARLRLLLEPTTSPTVHRLLSRVRRTHPAARVTFWTPVAPLDSTLRGAAIAFGRALQPHYDLRAADVIVALDADPLGAMPFALHHARAWAERRNPQAAMNRLYAIECMPSVTGMMADHRFPYRSSEVANLALALAAALPSASGLSQAGHARLDAPFLPALARDLSRRPPGTTLILVGERQPPAVHALGFAMNHGLGNFGKTIRWTEPVLPVATEGAQDLRSLADEMHAGAVDTLVILEGNPVYAAPADLDFEPALARVRDAFHLAPYEDETAQRCASVMPAAHFLESWGDGRACDGTLSIVQPLIRPLHGGRTPIELLAALGGDRAPDPYRLVRETHGEAFAWEQALARGAVAGTAFAEIAAPAPKVPAIAAEVERMRPSVAGLELNFFPSPTVHDGRFTNNPWLLEQPEPATKLTWDNAALVGPATAARLGVTSEAIIELEHSGRTVTAPVLVVPGHADDAISLWLGYGRAGGESIAAGRGVNAYRLRTSGAPDFATGAHLGRRPGRYDLATTQTHFAIEGRTIALTAVLADYLQNPHLPGAEAREQPSLMAPVPYEGVQWAMSIDLTTCTGCSACMVACQAENNLPVVGKENVLLHREMHWLRIDSYRAGPPENPKVVHQPMACQHCELAPCEYVCPVNATVHSPDGLNEMVYNRCVGTRFCSNNCPYKVRRFNWFNWNKHVAANRGSYEAVHNPDVTVRDRGVMEKCTYCVQRIRQAEISARLGEREIRPGEVRTACQQACPTGAIAFGSLSHSETEMVRRRNEPRAYAVLADQGTRPRTLYLARIGNPNPEVTS